MAGVAGLAGGEGCLVRRLLGYFGEDLGHDCGHCGPCAGDHPVRLTRAHAAVALSREELNALRTEQPRALASARQLARFLCGITSPAIAAAKLTRHPRFGAVADAPFAVVMAAAQAALS